MLRARAECLDWALVGNERHAERVLGEFVAHYNQGRPHRGIDLEQPVGRLGTQQFVTGKGAERIDRPGGLLHEYYLAA